MSTVISIIMGGFAGVLCADIAGCDFNKTLFKALGVYTIGLFLGLYLGSSQ